MGTEDENVMGDRLDELMDLAKMAAEPLHPDLEPWVEDNEDWGKILRHPLVYQFPLVNPGYANRAYDLKRKDLAEAVEEQDWSRVIWLHERPYRLRALIDYCIGRYDDEEGEPMPLCSMPEHWQLAADVWVDSENIEQTNEEWRAIIGNGDCDLWLGTEEEKAAFNALPDPIPAWRGGTVGDWSWTTDIKIAEFFSRRSGYPPRFAMIPKADVFGYFTRRGESELLVRLTEERMPLVYPNLFDGS